MTFIYDLEPYIYTYQMPGSGPEGKGQQSSQKWNQSIFTDINPIHRLL